MILISLLVVDSEQTRRIRNNKKVLEYIILSAEDRREGRQDVLVHHAAPSGAAILCEEIKVRHAMDGS
jgi:hypothetical protein